MNLDSVKEIIDAEKKAEKIKLDANLEVQRLQEKAAADLKKAKAKMQTELEKMEEDTLQRALDDGQEQEEQVMVKAKTECKQIELEMASRQDETIKSVIKKVGDIIGSC